MRQRDYGPWNPNNYRPQWWMRRAETFSWRNSFAGFFAFMLFARFIANLFRPVPRPRHEPQDLFKNW